MTDDLPPHVTEEEIRDAVRESGTMLEFQQRTRIGRRDAKRILAKLGLSDQVAIYGPDDLENFNKKERA